MSFIGWLVGGGGRILFIGFIILKTTNQTKSSLVFDKNHKTVTVGGHPNPTLLPHAEISPAASSGVVWLGRRSQGHWVNRTLGHWNAGKLGHLTWDTRTKILIWDGDTQKVHI